MADDMRKFAGFQSGKFNWVQIPAPFFSELLPLIDDLAELKLALFFFWAIPQKEGEYVYLRRQDFAGSEDLMRGLAVTDPDADPETILDAALERAVKRQALLRADVELPAAKETLYFFNTPHGRAAIDQINAGQWQPGDSENPVEILPAQPNIYRLYHNNFGAMTPMIAEELKDMEKDFPEMWIVDAMRIAVQKEARNLRYVRAVLERWRKEGREGDESLSGETDRNGKRYVSGKYADFIEH